MSCGLALWSHGSSWAQQAAGQAGGSGASVWCLWKRIIRPLGPNRQAAAAVRHSWCHCPGGDGPSRLGDQPGGESGEGEGLVSTPRTTQTGAGSCPSLSATATNSDQAVAANVTGAGNVVVGGQGNQVLNNVTAAGDVEVIARDKIVHQTIQQAAPERPTLPKGHAPHNLPSIRSETPGAVSKGFVGRQVQLEQLSELLKPPAARVFLTGMGGIGKSELALQYAYAAMERYRGGILRLDARQGFDGMALEVISFVRGKFPSLIPDEGEAKPICCRCAGASGRPRPPHGTGAADPRRSDR